MAGFRVPTNVKKHFRDFEETTDEMEEDNEDTYTEPSKSFYLCVMHYRYL
jgi:hypothetical protein